MDQSRDNGRPLLHPMGIGGDHISQAGGHLKKLPVPLHPFPAFFGRNPVDIRDKIDVLVTGQMLIKKMFCVLFAKTDNFSFVVHK